MFSSYANLVIAGPMVRVSTLPFRETCAAHGADVVFSEEIIAARLYKCRRELVSTDGLFDEQAQDSSLPTPHRIRVEFASYGQHAGGARRNTVFSTLPKTSPTHFPEGAPVVLQLGCAEPVSAAKAALLTMQDVDGFDVNMGCPKAFSVQNQMGSTLMKDPQRARRILVAIRVAIGPRKPLSYKMRLFEDVDASVAHIKLCTAPLSSEDIDGVVAAVPILSKLFDQEPSRRADLLALPTLVHSVSLHARLIPQRSEVAPRYELAQAIVAKAKQLLERVPAFVFNGSLGMCELKESQNGEAGMFTSSDNGICVLDAKLGCVSKAALLSRAKLLGFDGALSARGCMWNPTIFGSVSSTADATSKCKPFSADVIAVHKALFALHMTNATAFQFAKYQLTRALPEFVALASPLPPELQLQEDRHQEVQQELLRLGLVDDQASGVGSGTDRKKGAGTLMAKLSDETRDGKTVEEVAFALGFTEKQSQVLQRRYDLSMKHLAGLEMLAIQECGLEGVLKGDFIEEARDAQEQECKGPIRVSDVKELIFTDPRNLSKKTSRRGGEELAEGEPSKKTAKFEA